MTTKESSKVVTKEKITSTTSGIGGTAPPGQHTIGPTPPPDYVPPIGPVAPTPPPVFPITPIPLIPSTPTPPPISSDPLPTIPTPTISEPTTTVKPPPTPQFKDTDEGTIITNLAEIKAYNRTYNDAVDALAKYKQGNSYDIVKLIQANDSKAESAAKLLLGVSSTDISSIKSSIREHEALQKEADDWMGRKNISIEEYNKLSPAEQAKHNPLVGITITQFRNKELTLKTQGLSEDEISWELKDYYIKQDEITASEYAKMTGEDKEYYTPNLSTWEYITPWSEEKGETVGDLRWLAGAGTMGAELIIPGVYLARKWSDMADWEKGMMIGLDIASLIPIVGFGVRGAAAGVAKGMTRSAAFSQVAIAQIKAPYTMIRYPLATLKTIPQGIKEATHVFYAPFETVMQSRRGMATFMSDVRLFVGGGGEVASETLHAMNQLTGMAIAGTKGKYRVGLDMVTLEPVQVVKTMGVDTAVSSSSMSERLLLTASKKGYVPPNSGGLYAAPGGTQFVDRTSGGAVGGLKAFNVIQIPEGIKEVPAKFQKILHDKGFVAYNNAIERAIKSGELVSGAYPGTWVYRNSAENELRIIKGVADKSEFGLYPVQTGKVTTFKWVDPNPRLMDEALTLRKQAVQLEGKLADLEKSGIRLETNQLGKEIEDLLGKAKKLETRAIKEGTPRKVELDIDHMRTIDPATGEEYWILNWTLDPNHPKVKPFTFHQAGKLKIKAFYEIPKRIFVPSIQRPKLTPSQQINMVANELETGVRERFMSGLHAMDGLVSQKIPTNVSNKWRIDLSIVDSVTSNNLARDLEKYISRENGRVYGSLVDYVQTGNRPLPGLAVPADFDVAFKNSKKATNDILNIAKKHLGDDNVRAAQHSIEVMKDGRWVKLCDVDNIANHIKMFERPAFGYTAAKPVNVKTNRGISIEMDSLVEQTRRRGALVVMFPGWGTEIGHMGPEAAAKFSRIKDVRRFESTSRYQIQVMRDEAQGLSGVSKKGLLNKADDIELSLNRLLALPDDTTWRYVCR